MVRRRCVESSLAVQIIDSSWQEELSLLQLEGLNSVTICYILSRCTFDQFVAFSKDERQQALGRICGISRLVSILLSLYHEEL